MNIARINKATGLVENIEVWAEVPAETPDHLFVEAGSAGIGWSWDGEALSPPPVPFTDHKSAKRAEIVAAYDAVIAAGYPWVAPGGASETLQVRENDLSNWLGLKDSCNEAIAAGKGADPCPLPIRCTSNASYNLTFSETAAVMRDLRTWLSQALAVLWAKKDACRDATTQAELDAINPATGWPN